MIAEIGAGLTALQAAMDLAKGLNAANTQTAINDIKIELQQRILDAQASLIAASSAEAATTQRIRELEQQIVDAKDWETEKQRYKLTAIDTGAFAYMHKPGMENGEPAHWACTECFKKRQISLLQNTGQKADRSYALWKCNACKSEVTVSYRRKPSEAWPAPKND